MQRKNTIKFDWKLNTESLCGLSVFLARFAVKFSNYIWLFNLTPFLI